MIDAFGRRIEYLRISVTDKCNLRCVYCMPEEGLEWIPRSRLLDFGEIETVVRTMAGLGLRRIRLTGGEPLVRPDLPQLVARLASVPGIIDLALSTNGVLLEEQGEALRSAGLQRINLSLDSLDPERFDRIVRRAGSFERVRRGLDAALRLGFDPIKVNVVLLRGVNDDEIEAFADLTRGQPLHVRFIEVMPTGANLPLSASGTVGCDEALARLERMGPLTPVSGPTGNGPARYFRFPRARGTVGVITPMSHNFCDRCNRVRLTADGQLRPCLFGSLQTDLRTPLREGLPLEPFILETLRVKPLRHELERGSARGSGGLVALSQTGG